MIRVLGGRVKRAHQSVRRCVLEKGGGRGWWVFDFVASPLFYIFRCLESTSVSSPVPQVRIGRLLEKLDVVAASSAYLHVDPDRDVTAPDAHQALPYYIVRMCFFLTQV